MGIICLLVFQKSFSFFYSFFKPLKISLKFTFTTALRQICMLSFLPKTTGEEYFVMLFYCAADHRSRKLSQAEVLAKRSRKSTQVGNLSPLAIPFGQNFRANEVSEGFSDPDLALVDRVLKAQNGRHTNNTIFIAGKIFLSL